MPISAPRRGDAEALKALGDTGIAPDAAGDDPGNDRQSDGAANVVAMGMKVYFTQSVMQNPTGTDMSPQVAFKVLQAAERHNFIVVEDDIFCDLQVKTTPRLATLDQLDRVIYARSFSKTLSGSLRVGFVACSRRLPTNSPISRC